MVALNNLTIQRAQWFVKISFSWHLVTTGDCLDLNQAPQILPCPQVGEVGSFPALAPVLSPAQFHQRQGKFSAYWLIDVCNGLLTKTYNNNDNIVKQEINTCFEWIPLLLCCLMPSVHPWTRYTYNDIVYFVKQDM